MDLQEANQNTIKVGSDDPLHTSTDTFEAPSFVRAPELGISSTTVEDTRLSVHRDSVPYTAPDSSSFVMTRERYTTEECNSPSASASATGDHLEECV